MITSAYARLAVALVVVLALVGCSTGQPVTRSTAPTTASAPSTVSVPGQPSTGPSASALAKKKAAAQIADCPETGPAAPVDGGLPQITLDCLGGGRPVDLSALRGTPMVINVWAQWCGPCRTEAPYLREVAAQAGDRVLFLGIDYADPRPDLAIEFADLAGWRYPQLVDPEQSLQVPLRIPGPPITVLVTADGRIAYTHGGPFTSADQLRDLINQHLGVAL